MGLSFGSEMGQEGTGASGQGQRAVDQLGDGFAGESVHRRQAAGHQVQGATVHRPPFTVHRPPFPNPMH
jgi:hypothetical protein